MGYTHYWYRPLELDAVRFAALVTTMAMTSLYCEAGMAQVSQR